MSFHVVAIVAHKEAGKEVGIYNHISQHSSDIRITGLFPIDILVDRTIDKRRKADRVEG